MSGNSRDIAAGHPFKGRHGPTIALERLVAEARRGSVEPFLELILRDPHLSAMGTSIDYRRVLQPGTIDADRLVRHGRGAVRDYVKTRGDLLRRTFRRRLEPELADVLCLKLRSLGRALEGTPPAPGADASLRPRPSHEVRQLFGRQSRELPLEPVVGARVVHGSGDAEADVARFAWQLAPRGERAAASCSARIEVGRSVFVGDCDVLPPDGARPIRSQVLLKGVGPTPYAGNRYSGRVSGAFTLVQGQRDWELSALLWGGGVPVYRPLALIALPYWEWHPRMGWRPLCVYARCPLENLRVSDLLVLGARRRRVVLNNLRGKLAALAGLAPGEVSGFDVARFFTARLGRIAGLFEGGRTLGGMCFFHGMLHPQNVSLLGEVVDFSESPGLVGSRRGLVAEYARSAYTDHRCKVPPALMEARTERAVFQFLVGWFVWQLGEVMARRELPRADILKAIFNRAYWQGRDGAEARDVREVLESSRAPFSEHVPQKLTVWWSKEDSLGLPPSSRVQVA